MSHIFLQNFFLKSFYLLGSFFPNPNPLLVPYLQVKSSFYVFLKGEKLAKKGEAGFINAAFKSNFFLLPMKYIQMSPPWRKSPA